MNVRNSVARLKEIARSTDIGHGDLLAWHNQNIGLFVALVVEELTSRVLVMTQVSEAGGVVLMASPLDGITRIGTIMIGETDIEYAGDGRMDYLTAQGDMLRKGPEVIFGKKSLVLMKNIAEYTYHLVTAEDFENGNLVLSPLSSK